jgi:hypothetical protein
MRIPSNKYQPKYISFVYGKYWQKGTFKLFGFVKTPLGWDMNIWRFVISYDNHKNLSKNNNNQNISKQWWDLNKALKSKIKRNDN